MGAQGFAELDFGAFPGKSDASVAVTGQATIAAHPTSSAEAFLCPVATSDHTADEHMVETLKVFAHTIVAGTGFTISGFNTGQINEAPEGTKHLDHRTGQGLGTRIYGKWTVAWAWN